MARFLADIDLKFGVGFDAKDEQQAKETIKKTELDIKNAFLKEYGSEVKIKSRIKKLPF